MSRFASLVLVSSDGELLGVLPPIELACPFWSESSDVAGEVQSRFGVSVVLLRLLDNELPQPPGGRVTYLAELGPGALNVELGPVSEPLRERALSSDPKRMPWAALGGPARSLEWARSALAARGPYRAVQHRTWNLSTLWRLEPASSGERSVWLKQVPWFMKYESAVLSWLNRAAPGAAPELLAADSEGRSLLAHVEGEDLYGAPVALRQLINEQLHVIQTAAAESLDELLELGVPDLRGARRAANIREQLLAWSPDYPGLGELLEQLDEQLSRLEDCGLPATLVHADNHPGNARGSAEGVKLLDWGEAFVGDPVTDVLGAIAGLSPAETAPLLERWCANWKRLAPGCDPERALTLGPFLRELSGASLYGYFLSQIETSEQPYHRDDVPRCLAAAQALLGSV